MLKVLTRNAMHGSCYAKNAMQFLRPFISNSKSLGKILSLKFYSEWNLIFCTAAFECHFNALF